MTPFILQCVKAHMAFLNLNVNVLAQAIDRHPNTVRQNLKGHAGMIGERPLSDNNLTIGVIRLKEGFPEEGINSLYAVEISSNPKLRISPSWFRMLGYLGCLPVYFPADTKHPLYPDYQSRSTIADQSEGLHK